jgi:hypothetical protein
MVSNTPTRLRHRGLLIHFSHYDPNWIQRKATEERFDLRTGLKVVDVMADVGMNLLVIDIEDGVVFKNHPELRRRYSVPIAQLETLAEAARERGIDVVPKLNFSKSHRHLHDEWLRPHTHPANWLRGRNSHWRTARDVIAEAVRACKPRRFFHVSRMRTIAARCVQYVEDIQGFGVFQAHSHRPWCGTAEGRADRRGTWSRGRRRRSTRTMHVLWTTTARPPRPSGGCLRARGG